ncbi:TIGR03960 family B12-binding radical SAM protein [Tessaracoccus sp. SD287]|uniref:TIGR03960 family B12-binding radical SAM protein n=1 Tax=Tessaracoccus sp. SD287 TaxID=2782008 RepID=UPI001A96D829|nr:TIGR03960 family B12-binding radical SAM protein [Tessaracoccus sp. SD287]MBO1031710.1 TIGR03960 family B12-binding radical SAM protein [Tessaracoccus sp. SD287]
MSTVTEPEILFPRLEPLLAQVSKPIQYVGGEHNSVRKDWNCGAAQGHQTVRWCLMYPDAYEVGQPNQGVAILYEILNERDWILAERTYSVWPDMAEQMRSHGIPQFTLDSHRAVGQFDVLGLSFATELGYTNMLAAIDLANLPLHAVDRREHDPIVLAGGHAAFNPEPIADFIDAAVIGDGEEASLLVSEIIQEWKAEGRPGGRDGLLLRLASTGSVYVPKFYEVTYLPDGRIQRVAPTVPEAPFQVRKHTLMNLDEWPYPKKPIVPLAETVHERYSVEIFRGCTRGCRFCQAGMITRPVRERSIETIGTMVAEGLKSTGLEEVGLLSLSSADHSEIGDITKQLADRYEGSNVSLSLPSTRVDAFNIDLANELSRNGRRSGLTFAPEGGSERMRKVINKMVSEDDLIQTVATAFGNGWRQVKLYFMCGLPTETDEDVLAIADMAARVIETGRQVSGTRDIRCTVSIGGFVPKPHTPFQWAGQTSADIVDDRLHKLRDKIKANRQFGKAIGMRYHDGRPGIIEGLLSRGDRRVGRVIEEAWRQGGKFDGWSEHFSYDRWVAASEVALAGEPVDLDWYTTRERDYDEVLPWDHLDAGLDRDWLWEDWQDAIDETEVDDCRWTPCYDCGVCPQMSTEIQIGPTGQTLLPLTVVGRDLS